MAIDYLNTQGLQDFWDAIKAFYSESSTKKVDIASRADALSQFRNIILQGDATGSAYFDGSKDITIITTVPEVTDAIHGLMTSAQKIKLDGLEEGAEVNKIVGINLIPTRSTNPVPLYIDQNREVTIDIRDYALISDVQEESSRAQEAEYNLTRLIDEERRQRESDSIVLQAAIDAESLRAQEAEASISGSIAEETAARIEGDTALNTRINNLDFAEIGAPGKFVFKISQIDGQISSSLASFIDNIEENPESTTAPQTVAIKSYVDTEISEEKSERQSADTLITEALETEASTRESADNTLQSNIVTEATTRLLADNVLQQNLDDETSARILADTSITERIDSLDFDEPGSADGFIYSITQEDGQISATKATFIDDVRNNAESTTAPQTIAIKTYVDEEVEGASSELEERLEQEIQDRTDADTSINERIDDLDFAEIGQDGKFVYSIEQSEGQISSSLSSFIDDISTTVGGVSTTAPQSAAVRNYVDTEISTEANLRSTADTSLSNRINTEAQARIAADDDINNRIDNLDFAKIGQDGKFVHSIQQINGLISSTLSSFISDISTPEGGNSTTAPQAKAVRLYVDTETTRAEEAETSLSNRIEEIIAETTGIIDVRIAEEATIREEEDDAINRRIDNLDLTTVGSVGSFISSVGQSDGQLSASKTAFITDIAGSSTSSIAPTTQAVKSYVDSGLEDEANIRSAADILLQENIDAESQARAEADTSINERIDSLDFSEISEDGSFISSISQTDGQISATLTPFINDLDTTEAETAKVAPQTKAVKSYVDAETSRAIAVETSISERIDNLDLATVGATGSFISSVGQEDGQLTAASTSFISNISTAPGSTSTIAPQSKAVKAYVDNTIAALDVPEVGSDGDFIYKIKEDNGKISATSASFIDDISTTNGSISTTAPQAKAVKTYVDNVIDSLDVLEVGKDGDFILKIKEDDGKITATTSSFISDISTTDGAISTTAPQSKAVKDYVDAEIQAIDTSITEIIESLDFNEIGQDGKFVYSIKQEDGQISSTLSSFIDDISTTPGSISTTAPQSKAVKDYVDNKIDSLDVSEVGSDGNFILKIREDDGKITATTSSFISDIASSTTSTTAPQTKAVKDYVDATIEDLDVSEIGSNGNFIFKIKEDDGKITATTASFISDLSTTDGGASTTAPQAAAVKTYVDTSIQNLDTSITEVIEGLDFTEIGENGKFVYSIKQENGQISSTLSSFISDISTTPGSTSTTAPQAKAVKTYVDDTINSLDVAEVGSDGNFILKIKEDDGKITATTSSFISDITSSTTSTTAPQTKAVKKYVDDEVASEAALRLAADTTLQNSLNVETTARTNADTSLSNRIDERIVGFSSGTTENHIVTWGSDGYHVKDSGYTIETSVPPGAVFTDTTYSASDGVTLTGTNFTNSGVRSVTASTSAGYIDVNTNGTTAGVHINADIAAGTGISVSTSSTKIITNAGVRSVIQSTEPGHILVDTNGTTADLYIAPPLEAGEGINTDNNIITNTGVRAISDSTTNGAIEVNTNGTTETITVYEHYSSTASGNYGNATAQTPDYDTTFNVPYITVNNEGHITAASNVTVKIPAAQTSLPTQYGLTIQTNGTTQVTDWTGTTSTTVNITYDNVGAASAGHTHNNYSSTVSSTGTGNLVTDASISGNTLTITKGQSTTGIVSDTTAIPTAAAVRSFVNSSINSMAAFYITKDIEGDAFATKAELDAAIASGIYYSGGHLRDITNNDYCMVLADETHDNATCRYMFTVPEGQPDYVHCSPGDVAEAGVIYYEKIGDNYVVVTGLNPGDPVDNYYTKSGSWSFQYIVNTAFTAAQTEALNSGIDSTLTSQITTNANDISSLSSNKADKATTLAGYGITDAKIENGVITLGNDTITPLTSHPSISTTASTSSVAPGFGSTFSAVQSITKDANGHVTDVITSTVTVPSTTATTQIDGLMTTAQVTKLEGIEVNANNYTHPSITATNTTSTTAPGFGGTFTAVDSETVNNNGHVTSYNTKTITIPSSTATTQANGLMTTGQVTKLEGIEEEANKYIHPTIAATSTTSAESLNFGSTFTTLDGVTVNENGHVTEYNTKTITLPSSTATTLANGLMTTAQVTKLNGIEDNANNYSHPTITVTDTTSTTSPGFGSTFTAINGITVNENGHVTSLETETITIPNSTATTLANGLMTTGQVTKLEGIEEEANKYIHPSITAESTTSTTAPGFGDTFTAIDGETVDSNGHVTGYNTKTITIPNSTATTVANGLMTTGQVTKLEGIEDNANNYSHPTYTVGGTTTSSSPGFGTTFTAISDVTVNEYGHVTSLETKTVLIPDSAATTQADGLMTTAQVTKLDGIEEEANKYVHPSVTLVDTTSTTTPGFGDTFTAIDSEVIDSDGHVTEYNTKTITIPSSTATTQANGLMTTSQVTKLEGIEDNANNYIHPTYAGTSASSTTSPNYGETFTAIDSLTITNGHIDSYNVKTVTLPTSDNTDTYPSSVFVSSTSGNNLPVITIERAGSTTSSIAGNIPLASSTVNGVVSTTNQTFAGNKTFLGSVTIGDATLSYSSDGFDNVLTISFGGVPVVRKSVGGKIYYIDPSGDGVYRFFDSNGDSVEAPTVGTDCTGWTYEVIGSTKDKYYVYNDNYQSDLRWTYYQDGDYVNENISGLSTDIGKGRSNTNIMLTTSDGAYVTDDSNGVPTIWYAVQQMNNNLTNGCEDWYIPSRDEAEELRKAITFVVITTSDDPVIMPIGPVTGGNMASAYDGLVHYKDYDTTRTCYPSNTTFLRRKYYSSSQNDTTNSIAWKYSSQTWGANSKSESMNFFAIRSF